MPIKDAVTTILNRNSFYRDGYRLLLKVSLIQSIVIIVLVLGLVGIITTMKPKIIYFATTSDGRIINVVPLNEPYLTDAQVIAWSAGTSQNVMRFGYNDYRDRLQQSAANFTSTGWTSFNKALQDASYIDTLMARKQVMSLEINAAPEIGFSGVINGVYTWRLHVPVTVKFDGDPALSPISAMLKLQIVRVSTLQNPDGISVEQWILSAAGSK